jgi:hypothetical protein
LRHILFHFILPVGQGGPDVLDQQALIELCEQLQAYAGNLQDICYVCAKNNPKDASWEYNKT